MSNTMVLLLILLAIAMVAFVPFVFLWSLNTLFGMGLAYSFINWLAALVLIGLFGKPNVNVNKPK